MPLAAANAAANADNRAVTAPALAPTGRSKKRLRLLLVAAMLLVVAVGCAALWLHQRQALEREGEDDAAAATASPTAPTALGKTGTVPDVDTAQTAGAVPRTDTKSPPTFLALEAFTVNLADREIERYAQVGVTLEIADSKVAEQIKAYMPAIRNNILMAIADKTAPQLIDREGKLKLAAEIARETARSIGYTAEAAAAVATAATGTEAAQGSDGPRKKSKRLVESPIRAVHFSNFIIQ